MKKIYALGAVAMALLTTGCSNDLTNNDSGIDNTGKERIILSAGDDGETVMRTRAGFTDKTRIVARIVSNSRGSEGAKCVKTLLDAKAEDSKNTFSKVEYVSGKTRYWDDAHGRKSILSVYAVAVPNKETFDANKVSGGDEWSSSDVSANTIVWTVNKTQTTTTLADEDLTYSNNIQSGDVGADGVYTWDYDNNRYPTPTWDGTNKKMNATKHTINSAKDGRLYFTQSKTDALTAEPTTDPGHFDRGHMDFKHALSRIQINLIQHSSFDGTFELTGNFQLNAMPYSGTLDIKAGTWASSPTTGSVNAAKWTKAADGKTLTYEAQVLPGYVFTDASNDNTLQFTIGSNTYYITKDMLHDALESAGQNDFTMQQGTRYIFDITVKKAEIMNITATVAPWVNVEADNKDIDNSHVTFTFKTATGTVCNMEDINFYKYEETLDQIYTDNSYSAPASGAKAKAFDGPATLTDEGSDNKFETGWYYKDNQTAYHFRTLNDKAADAFDTTNKKTFTMSAGATASTDYHWGAPMATGATLAYDPATGFQNSIAKGVVSATKETNLTVQELHMMSNIVVDLKTVTGDAAIDLEDAEVTITNLYGAANVDMGIGLITATGDLENEEMTRGTNTTTASSFTYSVIPQKLDRGSGTSQYVGITIKTKDNNEYYIIADLSSITASSVTDNRNQKKDEAIKTWFPGHTYTYTFTLSKKKIEVITATVANWVNVTAADTELDLEK